MIDIASIKIPPGYRLVRVTALDSAVLRALDKTWTKIQEQDGAVPPVIFDLTPGRSSSCTSVGFDQPNPVVEINLKRDGSDGPTLTGAEVLEYLLHQAAHGIAGPVRGQEGRFHTAAFRDAAASLGLQVDKDATGYGDTSLAPGTRTRYKSELAALDRALARWEPTDQVKAERSSRNGVALVCSCVPQRKIRMRGNPDSIDTSAIRCEICGEPFAVASASST